MTTGSEKAFDALGDLAWAMATAEESLRVAERKAASAPGDWTDTIREIAGRAETTAYAINAQYLRLEEEGS